MVLPQAAEFPAHLVRAKERRRELFHPRSNEEPTTVFRWVNGAGDGVLGLNLDVYGEWLVAHVYPCDNRPFEHSALGHLQNLGYQGVYLKIHPKQANTVVDAVKKGLATQEPLWGNAAPSRLKVVENGIPYWVRLGDGLATGLYLDQRNTRERVRALSRDRRVLNLFAYTCGFGVAAGLGKAAMVVNVDTSKRALKWGEENLRLAEVPMDRQRLIHDDAITVLERHRRQGRRFDAVILDPPSYARTRQRRLSVSKDYPKLLSLSIGVLEDRGMLFACCNHAGTRLSDLKNEIREAAQQLGRRSPSLRESVPALDFPVPKGQTAALKVLEAGFL